MYMQPITFFFNDKQYYATQVPPFFMYWLIVVEIFFYAVIFLIKIFQQIYASHFATVPPLKKIIREFHLAIWNPLGLPVQDAMIVSKNNIQNSNTSNILFIGFYFT